MNNAQLMVRMLEEAGVRWVFGVPSGPVLPLIEALRTSSVAFVLTATETSAGFMAQTVGRLTGVPGVCVSTLGPGATNMATGVGGAWLDRAPVLAITCNAATPWLHRRVQMLIDHQALFQPLTKRSYALRTPQVAAMVAEAMALALAEPPGPVHLDLPEDVALAEATEARPPAGSRTPAPAPVEGIVERVREALGRSRRPLVVTGLTFTRSRRAPELLRFIETQKLPFVTTMHAKGFLPESHPSWTGVIGRARRSDVQAFTRRADLVLAVGYDPVEINYEEWVEGTPIIHLSTEAADTSDELTMLLNEVGDLDGIIGGLSGLPAVPNDWSTEELAVHRRGLEEALRPECAGLGPHQVLDVLRERLPDDGILTCDVGAHTHQIATQWRTDLPDTCLVTNGWSSMGYGMPAAYAAKLVHPERQVVGVVGDGGFQMTAGELAVAKRLGLAVPIIVLNDGWLGLMKVKQEDRGYGLSGVHLGEQAEAPPHYFGVPCQGVRNEGELADAVDWGLGLGGPSVIEAFVDVEPYSRTVYD